MWVVAFAFRVTQQSHSESGTRANDAKFLGYLGVFAFRHLSLISIKTDLWCPTWSYFIYMSQFLFRASLLSPFQFAHGLVVQLGPGTVLQPAAQPRSSLHAPHTLTHARSCSTWCIIFSTNLRILSIFEICKALCFKFWIYQLQPRLATRT